MASVDPETSPGPKPSPWQHAVGKVAQFLFARAVPLPVAPGQAPSGGDVALGTIASIDNGVARITCAERYPFNGKIMAFEILVPEAMILGILIPSVEEAPLIAADRGPLILLRPRPAFSLPPFPLSLAVPKAFPMGNIADQDKEELWLVYTALVAGGASIEHALSRATSELDHLDKVVAAACPKEPGEKMRAYEQRLDGVRVELLDLLCDFLRTGRVDKDAATFANDVSTAFDEFVADEDEDDDEGDDDEEDDDEDENDEHEEDDE